MLLHDIFLRKQGVIHERAHTAGRKKHTHKVAFHVLLLNGDAVSRSSYGCILSSLKLIIFITDLEKGKGICMKSVYEPRRKNFGCKKSDFKGDTGKYEKVLKSPR